MQIKASETTHTQNSKSRAYSSHSVKNSYMKGNA